MRRLLEAGAVCASLSTVFQQLLRLTQPYCRIATGARVFRQDGSLLTFSIAGGAVRAIGRGCRILLLFTTSDKAMADGRNCLNIPWRFGVIVQRFSYLGDGPGERVIRNGDIRPNRGDDLIFGQNPAQCRNAG